MLEIFQFYLGVVVQIFNRVLQGFEVTSGLGFGTFLLGCSLFVVFINLVKFRYGTNGFAEIKAYQEYKKGNIKGSKSDRKSFHEFSNNYLDSMGYKKRR